MFAQVSFATDKTLTFAVPESLLINVEPKPYCLFEKTLANMGYQLERINIPLMRTITETQKGNMAIVLVSRVNFKLESGQVRLPKGIALSSIPFLTTPISFYSIKNSQIIMDSKDWTNRYHIGVVRSIHTHDIHDYNPKESGNYYYYINSLTAFKGLLHGRQDMVISTELDYLSAQLTLNLKNEIKSIVSIGSVSVYPGFSFKYFGEEKAKELANQYSIKREKLTDAERKQCQSNIKTNH